MHCCLCFLHVLKEIVHITSVKKRGTNPACDGWHHYYLCDITVNLLTWINLGCRFLCYTWLPILTSNQSRISNGEKNVAHIQIFTHDSCKKREKNAVCTLPVRNVMRSSPLHPRTFDLMWQQLKGFSLTTSDCATGGYSCIHV